MSVPSALLVLADGRLPAGGHAHSGGAEEAVADGRVSGPADLYAYCLGPGAHDGPRRRLARRRR
ncbi:urease accessory protein, partial [Streptomyces sp. TverLS-915]